MKLLKRKSRIFSQRMIELCSWRILDDVNLKSLEVQVLDLDIKNRIVDLLLFQKKTNIHGCSLLF